jgi:3D-(3,5/4)-trihydroxycyclohexane-1,2-dione acylhydrolase (decyclizing)
VPGVSGASLSQGADGFNNMLRDSRGPGADGSVHVDFAAHARAKQTSRPVVVLCRSHPETWTEAGAWWEAGVPESLSSRAPYEEGEQRQLRWL